MTYQRVIPRDLFNEAKLLNCLGKLSIAILDCMTDGLQLVEEFDGDAFQVEQDPSDGSLSVVNYTLTLEGEPIRLWTPCNSRDKYPLYSTYQDEEYKVLDDDGNLCTRFGL